MLCRPTYNFPIALGRNSKTAVHQIGLIFAATQFPSLISGSDRCAYPTVQSFGRFSPEIEIFISRVNRLFCLLTSSPSAASEMILSDRAFSGAVNPIYDREAVSLYLLLRLPECDGFQLTIPRKANALNFHRHPANNLWLSSTSYRVAS